MRWFRHSTSHSIIPTCWISTGRSATCIAKYRNLWLYSASVRPFSRWWPLPSIGKLCRQLSVTLDGCFIWLVTGNDSSVERLGRTLHRQCPSISSFNNCTKAVNGWNSFRIISIRIVYCIVIYNSGKFGLSTRWIDTVRRSMFIFYFYRLKSKLLQMALDK